ncbi:hypothetical protein HFP15_20450 [Amycolatopsis sp. K13G38]|uniref:Uncharacterized protein n=1 Tax=Amycolatopsis acididurans TaxID=2724524 RepID=A0ABX1J607_9PSEU|nr:hypothetical protein [Amycolatopsis acididurans]NKQ55260.1 hypothetical protein [Amycolatopsis acididurans]
MNDEVSVAELLEREGWSEVEPPRRGRLRVLAVMMAVVIGCGLAAIMVHFGSQNPQADSPSLLGLPHGPTGGLAGGGVPSEQSRTEITDTGTTVVVTNQLGHLAAAVPTTTKRPTTVTVTQSRDSSTPQLTPTTTTNSAQPSDSGSNSASNNPGAPTTTTKNTRCTFIIVWC